jgi:hypothetical protein
MMQYDDDEVHIMTKQRYLKSEYDNLSQKQRQAIIIAIQEHEQRLAAKQPQPQAMPVAAEGAENPEAALPMANIV